jgi:type II secretory pathway component PulJ
MMWWGWLAIAVAVVAVVILAVVGLGTARRLQVMQRVAADAQDQPEVAALQTRIQALAGDLRHVQSRVQMTQERVSALKAAKQDDGSA